MKSDVVAGLFGVTFLAPRSLELSRGGKEFDLLLEAFLRQYLIQHFIKTFLNSMEETDLMLEGLVVVCQCLQLWARRS